MSEILLTVEEVSEKLKTSQSWVYKKCRAKIMPHIRVGGLVRFSEKDINDWLQSHRIKGCQKI